MIVPMKKVSLIILDSEKKKALKKLRKLGLLHIEEMTGGGSRLEELNEQITKLEKGLYILSEKKEKNSEQKNIPVENALSVCDKLFFLQDKIKTLASKKNALMLELDRLKEWGEIDLFELDYLSSKGIPLSLYEMPLSEYQNLDGSLQTVPLSKTKNSVKFLVAHQNGSPQINNVYKVELPEVSTSQAKDEIIQIDACIKKFEAEINSIFCYTDAIEKAIKSLKKDIEFETYSTGIQKKEVSNVTLSYFTGYLPEENVQDFKIVAKENSWGLLIETPTEEDNVPTKIHNNKFVSLIYPLTDFLGTVPGYFEYDISAWFLAFILIFFGIIFGDGGYGLLITAVAAIPIVSSLVKKKKVEPTFLLVGLFGLSTILWGTLTCTWFGLSPEILPSWLKSLSIPVISNVYADKIWYPFWTNDESGLTTSQNLQIFCFTLALIQLSVAHIKGAVRNKKSIKMLGDIGSILQLVGIYYVVLTLVVNGAVFGLDLVIGGIPVGLLSIAFIGVGFVMSFVFSNYEGKLGESILASLKDIVSVLLGVVNVFSDIVSYIRLWAVGLAGAAISATVNELASPMLGNFLFMIIAIVLLVFGHGLNMILNVLSVIVHGIRLNTLEFSSHLNMSWSGHKYDPFKE